MFEIKPTRPYTEKDLNWLDKNSRSSVEMKNLEYRPEIKERLTNMADYNVSYVGFPIWWYIAPTIVNTL